MIEKIVRAINVFFFLVSIDNNPPNIYITPHIIAIKLMIILIPVSMPFSSNNPLIKNIKGIINMRGIIVPVYNLARKFGFEDIDSKNSQLIITRINDMYLAVEVEGVEEIFDISAASLSEIPKIVLGSRTSYIKEVAKVKDELIIIIDIDKLLSEDEQKDMEEFVNEQKGTE